jgi:hypothetical protein
MKDDFDDVSTINKINLNQQIKLMQLFCSHQDILFYS